MQVLGSLEHLKKEIQSNYTGKFQEFKQETGTKFNEEKLDIEEKHKQDIKKAESEQKAEEKKVFRTTFAEEQLNAKKEYEQKREGMINNVFELATEKSKDVLLGNDYIKIIKNFIKSKGNIEITGNFMDYKTKFPGIKINKKISGIIVKKGNKIFDFTFGNFIESRKLDLRHKVSNILFKNVS